jgi:hypothetical protein
MVGTAAEGLISAVSEDGVALQAHPHAGRSGRIDGAANVKSVPIKVLRRGKHIIQFDGVWGYTLAERLRNLIGDGPAFVHSGAGKPWTERWRLEPTTGFRDYVRKVYLDVSPYTASAIRLKDHLGCDTEWMKPHYGLTVILRALGIGHPALTGMPVAFCADLARLVRYFKPAATKASV